MLVQQGKHKQYKHKNKDRVFSFNSSTIFKNDFGAKTVDYLIVGGGGAGAAVDGGVAQEAHERLQRRHQDGSRPLDPSKACMVTAVGNSTAATQSARQPSASAL